MELDRQCILQRDAGEFRELTLAGCITAEICEAWQRAAVQVTSSGRPVRVDCTQVESFDLSGLQILIGLQAHLQRQGGQLQLQGVSDRLADLFRLSGCQAILAGLDDEKAARSKP